MSKLESTVCIEMISTYKPYEAFVKDPQLDCMVTTKEAIDVAEAANGLRKVGPVSEVHRAFMELPIQKKSLPLLKVHIIDSLRYEDGNLLSSTRLRQDAMNGERKGFYQALSWCVRELFARAKKWLKKLPH